MFRFARSAFAAAPLALAFNAVPGFAQGAPAPTAEIDTERMIEAIEAEAGPGRFMGVVLVARGDEPLIDRAWGMADLEWDIANTADTKFRIASLTKQFTGAAVLLLAQDGKLKLDAPIATYLEDIPAAWNPVTVRHLLRHSSGIPSFTRQEDFDRIKYLPLTQDELIATFADLPLEFAPGSRYRYSNSGYVLLARIIETVSGESYADFLEANIFDPLGMEDTLVDDPALILPRRAEGYSPGPEGAVINAPYNDMGIPGGAGAMVSTTGDLLKWQRGLFGGRLLDAAHLAEYLTPSEHEAFSGDYYAHGVIVDRSGEEPFYWHDGGIEGFNSWLSHDPQRGITIAVLANLNGGAASKLGEQLTMLAQGRAIILPGERTAIELTPAELAEYEGVYALSPEFKITVFLEDGKLMTKATGQGPLQVFPEANDRFFLKVIDAQIGFNRDESGTITGATLYQNGQEIPAVRE